MHEEISQGTTFAQIMYVNSIKFLVGSTYKLEVFNCL
jgi:hypothetical protein